MLCLAGMAILAEVINPRWLTHSLVQVLNKLFLNQTAPFLKNFRDLRCEAVTNV